MPTQLSVHALTAVRGDRILLDAVTCAIAPGERAGVIGENGCGKSTLLRLLAGLDTPDEGTVTVTADGGVGHLAQDAPLPPRLTVGQVVDAALADLRAMRARLRELEPLLAAADPRLMTEYGDLATAFELRGGYDADARVDRALHGLGLTDLDRGRRLGELSGGEQARLHLAAVLAAGSEVLLLDEPTNHLDDAALTWLEEHLRARRGTTVVVSHDRVFLERVTTVLVEVDADRRTLVRHGGGYAGYLAERAANRARWAQAHQRWRDEVDRLRLDAATTARQVAPGRARADGNKMAYDRAGGRVQHSLASRVRHAEQRLRRLESAAVPPPPQPLRFTPPAGPPVAGVVLDAVDVAVAGRLHPTSLTVRAGERLLLTGANGAGKSTLLRVLAGELRPDRGHVVRRAPVGHLPQEVPAGRPHQTLLAAYAHGRPGDPEQHLDALLALGLFPPALLDVPVGRLSTGQRQRLGLARLFTAPAGVLLLDEPTNHLSLALVEELEEALGAYPGAVVVVSHDRRLRARWPGATLPMTAGRLPAAPSTV